MLSSKGLSWPWVTVTTYKIKLDLGIFLLCRQRLALCLGVNGAPAVAQRSRQWAPSSPWDGFRCDDLIHAEEGMPPTTVHY